MVEALSSSENSTLQLGTLDQLKERLLQPRQEDSSFS